MPHQQTTLHYQLANAVKRGLLPRVRFFTPDALVAAFEAAGFEIEHRWQPDRRKALFVIARKETRGTS